MFVQFVHDWIAKGMEDPEDVARHNREHLEKVLEGAKRLKDGWARYSLFNRGHWNSAPATAVTRSKHAEARARPVSPYTTVLKEMDNIDRRRKEGQSTDDN